MQRNDPAIRWLLNSNDPSVRYLTLTDLLGATSPSREAAAALKQILDGPRVKALLAGQHIGKQKSPESYGVHPGGFGVHPYKKWDGAHWRLVSLVELGIPARESRAVAAADQVLQWLTGESHRSKIKAIDGRVRRCGSQEGNALAVCSRLGLIDDARVQYLARSLIEWQWPDGGWNCDKRPEANHSSFYESLAPLWGLIEWHRATGEEAALHAAQRTAEMFLRHRLFRSTTTGEVIDPEWLKLHYPPYWHYDILQALLILSRLARGGLSNPPYPDGFDNPSGASVILRDARAQEALDIVEAKRQPDGCWKVEGFYWVPVGKRTSNVEVVDWGRRGPNEMITLNALRVLKAVERL
jgi:hypothetical protein